MAGYQEGDHYLGDGDIVPELETNVREIAKLLQNPVQNICSARSDDGYTIHYVRIPPDFEQLDEVVAGAFVLIDLKMEGDLLVASLNMILTPRLIDYYKANHLWPTNYQFNV